MSQKKVDEYKEFKKNRKANLEKERKAKKRAEQIWKWVGIALAAALVVALAITGWNAVSNWKQAQPIYTREELVIGDIAGISETEEESTPAEAIVVDDSTEAPAESTEAGESTEAASSAAN